MTMRDESFHVATEPVASLEVGHRLDRYELLAHVARGGMAHVWVARLLGKHGFEKLFAVKTILPQYGADEAFRRMFRDEATLVSGLNHPNVAQLIELGEDRGIIYLAMEWVDGDSLQTLHRSARAAEGRIPLAIVLRIIADAAAGLHAVHELTDRQGRPLGIVHRDLSPHNILISADGTPKLIDFGIAKARDQYRCADETATGIIKGKVEYMAPEQPGGHDIDRRADVFSLGAILYALIKGKPPYQGATLLLTLQALAVARDLAPSLEDLPAPVAAVLLRALAFKPEERFATAADMRDAIERAMTESGLNADASVVAAYAQLRLRERAASRRADIDAALLLADQSALDEEPSRGTSAVPVSVPTSGIVRLTRGRPSGSAPKERTSVGDAPAPSPGAPAPDAMDRYRARFMIVALALLLVGIAVGVLTMQRAPHEPAREPGTEAATPR